jgi:hypothetical protein
MAFSGPPCSNSLNFIDRHNNLVPCALQLSRRQRPYASVDRWSVDQDKDGKGMIAPNQRKPSSGWPLICIRLLKTSFEGTGPNRLSNFV